MHFLFCGIHIPSTFMYARALLRWYVRGAGRAWVGGVFPFGFGQVDSRQKLTGDRSRPVSGSARAVSSAVERKFGTALRMIYVHSAWCVWYLVLLLLLCFDIYVLHYLYAGKNVLTTSVEPRHNGVFSWKSQACRAFFSFSFRFVLVFSWQVGSRCPYWLY